MNILGISGSPHPKGNTAYAVRHAFYLAGGKRHTPVLGCWACESTRQCRFDDDMVPILDALRACDGLIIGSPIYFEGKPLGKRQSLGDLFPWNGLMG